MKDLLDKHYKNFADDYDRFLLYSPEFVRKLTVKMIEMLQLDPESDTLVDLGGGTGMYSIDILRQVPLRNETLCVDAYQEMLDRIPEGSHLRPICLDALTFSGEAYAYNKVLVKEAIHHVTEREALFKNLFEKLPSGGRILLVHVPPELDYPIFERALEKAKGWHAHPDDLEAQMKNAGFKVERDILIHRHQLKKNHYFDQIRSRFMSVLHHFSDEEMEEGLREMEERYGDQSILEFNDRFDFVLGIKE